MAEQRGRGRHLNRGGNFARKCISITPIGAPIYIWPKAAIPPAPPLEIILSKSMVSGLVGIGFAYRNRLHPRDSVNRCKTTEVLKCLLFLIIFCHKVITLKFTSQSVTAIYIGSLYSRSSSTVTITPSTL